MAADPAQTNDIKTTPLNAAHRALGAKMVPFAGYDMPVQYPLGVLGEHKWTRDSAGLFDVSHMGQAFITSTDGRHETVARALEALIPADIVGLKLGQQRYSQFLADDGGVLDDLMVTRSQSSADDGSLMLVVNAGCKDADYAHLRARLPAGIALSVREDRALIALQGPLASAVIAGHVAGAERMAFMTAASDRFDGIDIHISRSGYTGEDGYEISMAADKAEAIWTALLADTRVKPIGLGARDSLRLEGGLCLYGHELDPTTSPIEAGLAWSIQKRRREEGGFPGAARIQRELRDGPSRRRVGILPEGRAPAREHTEIRARDGRVIGEVTSGGFGPTLNGPLAMGYVEAAFAAVGTELDLMVRGKALPAKVVALPFVPNRFFRAAKA